MNILTTLGVFTILATFVPVSAFAQSPCNTNLAYLDAKLPRYDSSQPLRDLRQMILQEDMIAGYQQARAAGLSPGQIAQMVMQQADQTDAAAEQSAQCFETLTTGPSIRGRVDAGSYQFNLDSIQDACAGAYAAAKMGAMAMRESAINMVCLSRTLP